MKAAKSICRGRSRWLLLCFSLLWSTAILPVRAQSKVETFPRSSSTEFLGWLTNGPVVFQQVRLSQTNSSSTNSPLFRLRNRNYVATNLNFVGFVPESLSHLIWTNFLARTNGRSLRIWNERVYPSLPLQAYRAIWNTNCILWGMKGLTGLSPNCEADLGTGHSPITALTRRHGYTRGHGAGTDGINTNGLGLKIWFLATDNRVVEMKVKQRVVRTRAYTTNSDYTIVLFDRDLPASIEPLRVMSFPQLQVYHPYPTQMGVPHPIFMTEQRGEFSTGVQPLMVDIMKGGDSGCPNFIPLPGELIFFGGRTTTGPTLEMQADMDALCRMEKLDPRKYQMQWMDLSKFPAY